MAKPVKNWYSNIDGIPIFGDIVDSELRYYGPRAIWREFSRRDLGQKKAVFSGVIDLGYSSDELKNISTSLAGKKIFPLSITAINEEPTLGLDISLPHTGSLVPLNSLPFPQYRLAVTVDLQASDATSIIKSLESGWAEKTLLQNKFVCSADGVIAKAGFKVRIDVKSCISEIAAREGKRVFSKINAWKSVEATVQRNGHNWIVYYGNAEEPDDFASVETTLISLLVERCFEEKTVMRYDNGMAVIVTQLRDAASMGDAEIRVFVCSNPAKINVEIDF